tara:strand:- start:385 stop:657 length:273 start_codon:yes stop_codon:yes gene_type:complete
MWSFFQWAWNLSWGDGIALLVCLFVFWYGKKWIDNRFGSLNKKQKREMKALVREAMDEWTAECQYLTQDQGSGTYYCSKADCEGVRISDD